MAELVTDAEWGLFGPGSELCGWAAAIGGSSAALVAHAPERGLCLGCSLSGGETKGQNVAQAIALCHTRPKKGRGCMISWTCRRVIVICTVRERHASCDCCFENKYLNLQERAWNSERRPRKPGALLARFGETSRCCGLAFRQRVFHIPKALIAIQSIVFHFLAFCVCKCVCVCSPSCVVWGLCKASAKFMASAEVYRAVKSTQQAGSPEAGRVLMVSCISWRIQCACKETWSLMSWHGVRP